METGDRPHLHALPFLLAIQLTHAGLLALHLRRPIRLLFSALLLSLVAFVFGCTTGSVQRDYYIGSLLMTQVFSVILFNWMSDPFHDFHHERDHCAPTSLPFLRRVSWALCVLNSPRGVGWSYTVAKIPARPRETRWFFVRMRLLSACRWSLLLAFSKVYQRMNPMFSKVGMDLWSQGYIMLPVNILARFSATVSNIALSYSLLAAGAVALGLSSPADWPDIYGRWSDSYTMRRFWGRTYHQLLRRLTSGFGKACCNSLQLRQGTWQSRYTQLYVGFAVSGLIHCGGDLMVNPSLFGASFPFYFSQAIAITFEDAIIGLYRRSGIMLPQPVPHLVGYAWAIVWLCISAPWQINWMLKIGITSSDRMDPLPLKDSKHSRSPWMSYTVQE